jgi:hypothetical protein
MLPPSLVPGIHTHPMPALLKPRHVLQDAIRYQTCFCMFAFCPENVEICDLSSIARRGVRAAPDSKFYASITIGHGERSLWNPLTACNNVEPFTGEAARHLPRLVLRKRPSPLSQRRRQQGSQSWARVQLSVP